jgi:hypothetical protein
VKLVVCLNLMRSLNPALYVAKTLHQTLGKCIDLVMVKWAQCDKCGHWTPFLYRHSCHQIKIKCLSFLFNFFLFGFNLIIIRRLYFWFTIHFGERILSLIITCYIVHLYLPFLSLNSFMLLFVCSNFYSM